MPPRFSYWTIIAGGLPTAFRAAEREELLPTFTRLKEKQPDAEMKWFARGKLWASPEEAREQRPFSKNRPDPGRHERGGGTERRPDKRERDSGGGGQREARGRDWRPGGDHRDPRQPFKDAKKARNQRFKAEKFARSSRRDEPPRERPHGDPLAPKRPTGPQGWRPDAAARDRKGWSAKPPGSRDGARRQPTERDRNAPRHERRDNDWQQRGPKPQARGGSDTGSHRDWSAKPPRQKPHGDKLTRPDRHGSAGRPSGPARAGSDRDRPDYRGQRSESRWNQKPRSDARGTYRGEGHGDNSWKPKPPREERGREPGGNRPFAPRSFDRDRERGGSNQDQDQDRPPRPRGPHREPRPNQNPKASSPPRPRDPVVPPPGPPERGRLNRNKRRQ